MILQLASCTPVSNSLSGRASPANSKSYHPTDQASRLTNTLAMRCDAMRNSGFSQIQARQSHAIYQIPGRLRPRNVQRSKRAHVHRHKRPRQATSPVYRYLYLPVLTPPLSYPPNGKSRLAHQTV